MRSNQLPCISLFATFVILCASASAQQLTVVGWGHDSSGETVVPIDLTNATSVTAGAQSLVVLADGTVRAWGSNGDPPPVWLSSVKALAQKTFVSVALFSNGTVTAWGNNSFGGATVPPGLIDVVAIAAGGDHGLALRADGIVVGWGGQAGAGTIPPGLSSVQAIAAGLHHSLALLSNGTVVAWGWNNNGQSTVPAGLGDVISISGGHYHSMALKRDGTVVVWGGQSTDVQPPSGLANVVAISAGGWHCLALKADRTVVSWGDGPVPSNLKNVVQISGGYRHSLALSQSEFLSIGTQPQSVTQYRGGDAVFTVAARGYPPLTYQWLKNEAPIPGATSPTLRLQNVRADDIADYRVVITDVEQTSINSSTASLTVLDPRVETTTLNASLDTSIHSSGVNPQGSNTILAGTRNNTITDRGLLRFDVSRIPTGAVLVSASARLWVVRDPRAGSAANSDFALHRMLTPWDLSANWTQPMAGVFWAASGGIPGVDYAAQQSAITFVVGNGQYAFPTSAQGLLDIEEWRRNPDTNFGWLLKTTNEGTLGTARHFGSMESTSRPQLSVEYLPASPMPLLGSVRREGGEFVFDLNAAAGWIYRVEYSAFVDRGPWTLLTNAAAGGSPTTIRITDSTSAERRFYRVIVD